ncbi:hypothetical protein HDV00_009205 [Rhizophlyctis rosea]|nr:hypothetical protein HDV00_009205 [Rhizophlyctis rosea]
MSAASQHCSSILYSSPSTRSSTSPLPTSVVTHTQIRPRTYVKGPSRSRVRWFKKMLEEKAKGTWQPKEYPVMENRFWRVIGGMKIYKGVTPGTRNRRHPTLHHLHNGNCIWRLSIRKKSTGGRASTGRISVRHRGGGHKKRLRLIDWHRNIPGPHEVVRFEYDPNRSGELILLRNLATNEFSYMNRVQDVNIGDLVESFRNGIPEPPEGQDPISKAHLIRPGNCLMLKDIPVGTEIHGLSLRPGPHEPAKFLRAAGVWGTLTYTGPNGFAHVQLRSKEVRMFDVNCVATIGRVANELHHLRNWGKAGSRRHKGIRPTVRGIAMSPVDHPHGGGGKSKGGKQARTPWGMYTKGYKTVRAYKLSKKWYLVTPRWKAKAMERKGK